MLNKFIALCQRIARHNHVLITAGAIAFGFIAGALLIIFSTPNVLHAWRLSFHGVSQFAAALKVSADTVGAGYRAMFTGAIGSPAALWHSLLTGQDWSRSFYPLSETLLYATPLMIASIAVGIAFQTGIFNIGANGQAILGGITGTLVGAMVHAPMAIHLPLVLIAGVLGGVVCAVVPGILKAYTGAHEVIVTLMINYIMGFFLLWVLLSTPLQLPDQSNSVSRTVDSTAILPPLFGPTSGLRVSYGIFLAGAVVFGAYWFLRRSTLGFAFRITGANPYAARAAGINPKFIILAVFAISGGLAGLAGVTQMASSTHYVDGNFLIGSAGIGFTAITVALLGKNEPLGIMWGSLLFAGLNVGGRYMQQATGIPLDLATIIQSFVVLFVATPVLVSEILRIKNNTQGVTLATPGWGS